MPIDNFGQEKGIGTLKCSKRDNLSKKGNACKIRDKTVEIFLPHRDTRNLPPSNQKNKSTSWKVYTPKKSGIKMTYPQN